jgi:hypothetical protein
MHYYDRAFFICLIMRDVNSLKKFSRLVSINTFSARYLALKLKLLELGYIFLLSHISS